MKTLNNTLDLTWTEAADRYSKFCLLASKDETVFSTFRRNPIFCQIMEHFNQEQGDKYFNVIKRDHPEVLEYFKYFISSEEYGSPLVFDYGGTLLSPSTLRYIKVFTTIVDCMGSLNGLKIAEIGGGYGGQGKIIKDIYDVDYYFIDLPEVNELAKMYLGKLGITGITFYDYINIVKQDYDLVISNHAFSELNRDIQDYYNDMIIKRSKKGFFTCNVALNGNNGYGIADYEKMGDVKFIDEQPNTHPDNFVMYWK